MRKVITILMALSLAMLSGCGTKETTTTATTQATTLTTTTTEATTTEAKFENENDQFIADMLKGEAPSFISLRGCDIIEQDDVRIISVRVDNGTSFPTACSVLSATMQGADYYKGAELWINWSSGDKYISWETSEPDNYEKGLLSSSSTTPTFDITPQDIQEAFNQNLEGGD